MEIPYLSIVEGSTKCRPRMLFGPHLIADLPTSSFRWANPSSFYKATELAAEMTFVPSCSSVLFEWKLHFAFDINGSESRWEGVSHMSHAWAKEASPWIPTEPPWAHLVSKCSLLAPECFGGGDLLSGQACLLISLQNEVSLSTKEGGVSLSHLQLRLGTSIQELCFPSQWSVTRAEQSGSCRPRELPIR